MHNNPRIFFWAQLIGSLSFIAPVLTLLYLHRGLTLQDVLLLLVIDVLFSLLSEVPTGVFADKFGKKKSLLVAQILHIVWLLGLLVAQDQWMFYGIAAIAGVATSFHSGIKDALIYDSLKELKRENDMQRVWAKIRSAPLIGGAIAALLGAYLARSLTEQQFILVISLAIVFAVTKFVLLFFLREPSIQKQIRSIPSRKLLKQSIAFLRSTPVLTLFVVGQMFVYIPFWAFRDIAQPYLLQAGLSVIHIGMLTAFALLLTFALLFWLRVFDHITSAVNWLRCIRFASLLVYVVAALFATNLMVALLTFVLLYLLRYVRSPFAAQIEHDYIPSRIRATTGSVLSAIDSFLDIIIVGSISFLAPLGFSWILIGCAVSVCIGTLFPIRSKE